MRPASISVSLHIASGIARGDNDNIRGVAILEDTPDEPADLYISLHTAGGVAGDDPNLAGRIPTALMPRRMQQAPNEPADSYASLNVAGGVAGDDPAISLTCTCRSRQAPANQPARGIAGLDTAGGVAGDDCPSPMVPGQSTHGTATQHTAGGVAGADCAVIISPDQPARGTTVCTRDGDRGVAVADCGHTNHKFRTVMPDQTAGSSFAARYAASGVAMTDCTQVKAGQAATAFTAYVDIDQADVANDAVEVVEGEETDVVCINPFDEQVADGVSIAVERGLEDVPDGIPPAAGGPSSVDRAGGIAVRVVEVQRACQLIAFAAALADRFCPGGWERGRPYLLGSPPMSGLPSPSRS